MNIKTKSLTLLLLILCIGLVSATTIYSGESYELQLEKQYDYYSIIGNSTEVNISVDQDANNLVTITPNKYSEFDSFEIIFFDSEKETITVYQSSGDGGSSTKWRTKEVNVTNYETKEVEVEVIKEVPGETIEVEVTKKPWVLLGAFMISLIALFYVLVKKENTDERGYENNEQENYNASNDITRD